MSDSSPVPKRTPPGKLTGTRRSDQHTHWLSRINTETPGIDFYDIMIGSPDVLAFTSEGDLGGYPDAQVLPEEFSLPLLPLSHPWPSPAPCNRDCILVAEFSEQVGPGRGWCVCVFSNHSLFVTCTEYNRCKTNSAKKVLGE